MLIRRPPDIRTAEITTEAAYLSRREFLSGLALAGVALSAGERRALGRMLPRDDDKLTPWEFFQFTGQLFRVPADQFQKATPPLVERFNLEPFLTKPIEGLSHGTRQRVAIVSALLHDPEVIILDEPMVGLDPHHARVVKDILKERSLAGATVFVSTHQLSVAEEMADRIGIVHHGRLVAVGTRDELRRLSGAEGPLESTFLSLTAQEANFSEEKAAQAS